jgi:hypothetical protein
VANNRDSSKQKRARQNRAQREAREARAKAAATPAEERKAKYASSTPTDAPAGRKSRSARASDRPVRPPRPGDLPVDIDTLEGSWYKKRMMVPGGRQVLFGTLLTVLLVVMTLLIPAPIPEKDQKPGGPTTQTIFDLLGAAAIPLLAVPLIVMAFASYSILSPNRRRIWIGCSFVAALAAVVLGLTYIFPVGFLVYAVMRANKIEGPAPNSRAGRELAAAEAQAAEDDSNDDPSDADGSDDEPA